MSEEHFRTWLDEDTPGPLVPRSVVHREGLLHRAVNVLLFRSNGRLVLQRRATGKDVCPGLWDLSVGEHLLPDEAWLDGANRGLAEELSLHDVDLEPVGKPHIGRFDDPALGLHDHELQQTFSGTSDAPITADPEEVAATRTITRGDLATEVRDHPDGFTPWSLLAFRAAGLLDGEADA